MPSDLRCPITTQESRWIAPPASFARHGHGYRSFQPLSLQGSVSSPAIFGQQPFISLQLSLVLLPSPCPCVPNPPAPSCAPLSQLPVILPSIASGHHSVLALPLAYPHCPCCNLASYLLSCWSLAWRAGSHGSSGCFAASVVFPIMAIGSVGQGGFSIAGIASWPLPFSTSGLGSFLLIAIMLIRVFSGWKALGWRPAPAGIIANAASL